MASFDFKIKALSIKKLNIIINNFSCKQLSSPGLLKKI